MQTVPLGELGKVVSGSTPKTAVPKFWDGDIPWITPADLSNHDGIYFHGTPKKITKAGFDSCSTAMLPAGSILFSSRAPIGHCALTAYPVCTNQGFKNLVPNERLDPVYGYFALKFLTPAIVAMGRGATFAEINKELFESVQLPYCDLPEQRRIAEQLGQADRLVRTRRSALELSNTFLPDAFLELFGDYLTPACSSVFNDVLALPLSNGFFEKNSVYGTGVPVIWVDNLYHTMTINLENLRRARATTEQITTYQVMQGDLLFTRSSLVREGIGQVNIVPRLSEPALFECHVIRARVNAKRVNPFYALGLYRSAFGKAHILARANTATMTTISQDALEELPCPLPPLPLQQRFAALVERVERLRAVQREALRQAEHLFASLLAKAFSG